MRSVDTADGIIELGYAFRSAKALMSAVELGVFTVLAEQSLDRDTLRQRIGLAERGAADFLDALVALGLLHRDGSGRYANAPGAGRYLDARKPGYIGGLLENLAAREYGMWETLTDALRTGKPQTGFEAAHFRQLYADRERLRTYAKGMTGGSRSVAEALAAKFPWGQYRTFADIGTSQGCVPVQIASAHTHLTGCGFDLPVLAAMFKDYVDCSRCSDRLRFVPGDFFADPLPTADVLILGRVLHNWDLPTKRMLLEKAHDALPQGGALIVYERMIDDERRASRTGMLSSLNMLIMTDGGFDFTAADCIGWMRDAGFAETRTERLVDDHVMVVAIR